jgi:hypothetical protein
MSRDFDRDKDFGGDNGGRGGESKQSTQSDVDQSMAWHGFKPISTSTVMNENVNSKKDKRVARRKGMLLVNEETSAESEEAVARYFQEHQEQQKRQQVQRGFIWLRNSYLFASFFFFCTRPILSTSLLNASMSTDRHSFQRKATRVDLGMMPMKFSLTSFCRHTQRCAISNLRFR